MNKEAAEFWKRCITELFTGRNIILVDVNTNYGCRPRIDHPGPFERAEISESGSSIYIVFEHTVFPQNSALYFDYDKRALYSYIDMSPPEGFVIYRTFIIADKWAVGDSKWIRELHEESLRYS